MADGKNILNDFLSHS